MDDGIFMSISDASLANDDEKSQGGYIVAYVHKSIMDGDLAPTSILCWKSHKLRRVVKASLGSEALAMDDGLSELEWIRAMHAEICIPAASVTDVSRYGPDMSAVAVRQPDPEDPSIMVTDARALYDLYHRRSGAAGLDRRAQIDVAVLVTSAKAALVQFCLVMQEAGLSPMYVASHLQSQFLRSLSDPTFRSQAPSVSSATQVQHFPSRASQDASASASPRRAKAIVKTRTEEVDHGEAHNLTNVIKHMGFAELSKVGEKVTPKRASSVTIVSLNATGVLADRCSCACLRSDLRCVGQALQLAARVSKI
eukprot:s1629_g12.t1